MKTWVTFAACALLTPSVFAAEIGFIEDFALAKDRSLPIKQLIPGTEDYYYYLCLHLQNNEQYEKVDELTQVWIQRYGATPRVKVILNRQALLTYERSPAKTLEYLKRELGLQFNHQREQLDEPAQLPQRLDPAVIQRDSLLQAALVNPTNLDQLEDSALDWLATMNLNPAQRRALLKRVRRPDTPQLVKLLAEDRVHAPTPNFAAYPVHTQLFLGQLDELLRLRPELRNEQTFVQVYLSKLAPNDDVITRYDPAEQQAYLSRLWSYVQTLAPAHNSLKAHVLYYQLVHDRAHGKWDKARFLEYLKLPRNVPYLSKQLLESTQYRTTPANLQQDFSSITSLPPIVNDEPLVRSYLHHLLIDEKSYQAYEPFLNDEYLKRQFAETKIVNGLGEPEQWYSLLSPVEYQALRERVDLDFAATNKQRYSPQDAVSLEVDIKNVSTLIVKVFEINTHSFYREKQAEINTDINLDGLIPNHELTVQYNETPLRRMRRRFDFPMLNKLGVFVIDFIGNGKSSRAIIRKGQLTYLEKLGPIGQQLTVLDESRQIVPNASVWLSGREFVADKEGTIVVPYAAQTSVQNLVICRDGVCSLVPNFVHHGETFQLNAAIHVERETLLSRRTSRVLIRPILVVNGQPTSLKLLNEVRLTIHSTDLDGIATTKTVPDFKLFEDREAEFEFATPDRLQSIRFDLAAKVRSHSQNKLLDVAASESYTINETLKTHLIEELHLANIGGQYLIELLGRSGEPRSSRAVQIALKHRDFKSEVNVTLQTDDHGAVHLGDLDGIESIRASSPEGVVRSWPVNRNFNFIRSVALHAVAHQPISIPYQPITKSNDRKASREELALFELRQNSPSNDRFESLSIANGQLVIQGLEPGDYQLILKKGRVREEQSIRLRVSAGKRITDDHRPGFVVGSLRRLQLSPPTPLAIAKITKSNESLDIQLENFTKFSRVHVFATRYVPQFDAERLGSIPIPGVSWMRVPPKEASFVVGRNIGDEYRYILDRKFANKYPGNMLERPWLLLNPWPVRQTETGEQAPSAGSAFSPAAAPQAPAAESGMARGDAQAVTLGSNCLDFLAGTSAVLTNLTPDEKGVVQVPLKLLQGRHDVSVVAIEPLETVVRTIALDKPNVDRLDLRLGKGLDPNKHFVQQKRISNVEKGAEFVLADAASSRFELIDSLARAYGLMRTLNTDPKLAEFEFIIRWPKLEQAEKHKLYSKYACHELNFFLAKKDPEFFQSVVQPFLKNKRYPTFLDRWLLSQDLEAFRKPWEFARLNVAERILLGQRIQTERTIVGRHIKDLWDVVPPNPERFYGLFETVMKQSSLTGQASLADFSEIIKVTAKITADTWDDSTRENLPGVNLYGAVGKAVNERLAVEAADPRDLAEGKPRSAGAVRGRLGRTLDRKAKAEMEKAIDESDAKRDFYFAVPQDKLAEQLFRQLDKTQEWAENNYYLLPNDQQIADLIQVNRYWNEYALHDHSKPFRSGAIGEAAGSFAEAVLALAVLDLPFEAGEHQSSFEGTRLTLRPAGPAIIFHEEVREAEAAPNKTPILVSENFFRQDNRHRVVNNEQVDNFVTEEFVSQKVYGAQVVVTNPTSSRQRLEVLTQIPLGAIPMLGGKYTRTIPVTLEPFHTQTLEYHFYFPSPGEFAHFPVHISRDQQLVAHSVPFKFHVVDKPTQFDRASWDYVSQRGSNDEVLGFLKSENLNRVDLNRMAFRMANREFFGSTINTLRGRHVYHDTLWSYGIHHNDRSSVSEYLQHRDEFAANCGLVLNSPLLVLNPIDRKWHEHLEYRPLVNARAHQLGSRRHIVNDRLHGQYHRLLEALSFQRQLGDDDWLSVTYYYLVQDRIEEALNAFAQVNFNKIESRLQYDYLAAYLDMFSESHESARGIVDRYANYPVEKWRQLFGAIRSQLDELDGQKPSVIDPDDRTQRQTQLAAAQPTHNFELEGRQIVLSYQNLERVVVNYYLMDVELLFSRNPFVKDFSSGFTYIRPNEVQMVELPRQKNSTSITLPESLQSRNVLVEVVAGGKSLSRPYYSNAINLQTEENFGQLKAVQAGNGLPISKAYVKVYAKLKDGRVEFFKDGYTDLRGRFDYSSLSTNLLDNTERLSLLVMTDKHGATVREVQPPVR